MTPPDRVFAGYVFDLDGTVYLDDELLPGALEAIAAVRQQGARTVFMTNKPLETAEDYAAKLTRLGIPASRQDVVTAVDSMLLYLAERHPGARVLCITEPLLERLLAEAGFELTRDPGVAQVVAVAFDRTFDYAKLTRAYRAVRLYDAALVATNPDPYCPTADGGLPDCAAIVAAIEACTGRRAEAVLGKPSRHMARALLDRLRTPPAETALVGDRLATDIAMARLVGMTGVLTLSGATSGSEVAQADPPPDYIIQDLRELVPGTTGGRPT